MKKILITGGLGFLGSAIAKQLRKCNDVTILDNCGTNVVDDLAECQIIRQSIRDFYPEFHYDEIYHCASKVGPVGILKHVGHIIEDIVNDAQSVFNWAIKANANLLLVSSSEIYGRSGCFTETDYKIMPPFSARGEYAFGKYATEMIAFNRRKQENLKVVIIRPFNMIGPTQSGEGGFVVPRFIRQAKLNEALTVYYDGSQIRSFTYIEDVVNFIILAMSKFPDGEIFNVGNPANQITILQLAKTIIDLTESSSKILFINPKDLWGELYEEAFDKIPNIQKALKLGWMPQISLRQAIQEIINSQDEN